jgi:excisionase family DNA binding protein
MSQVEAAPSGTRLPGFAGFSSPLGTPVVQRGPEVGDARYLGVREYARLLGVSTATVYKAVRRGEIAHVRVSSVIRIPVGMPRP